MHTLSATDAAGYDSVPGCCAHHPGSCEAIADLRIASVVTVLATLVVATAMMLAVTAPSPLGRAGHARGLAEEELEQQLATQLRLEALREARADGTFGLRERIVRTPAPGWVGEQVMNPGTDDWEPAIAANSARSVGLHARDALRGEAVPRMRVPFIALKRSRNGGATWGGGKALCPCAGQGPFDPDRRGRAGHRRRVRLVHEVVQRRLHEVPRSRTDLDRPVPTFGDVAWGDKPVLATSDDGRDVYASFNGPTGGDPWIVQSHDFGATWTQTKVVASDRYFFAFDAEVSPDGSVVFSQSSIDYSGPGGAPAGDVLHHAFVSNDRGGLVVQRGRGPRGRRRGVRCRRL